MGKPAENDDLFIEEMNLDDGDDGKSVVDDKNHDGDDNSNDRGDEFTPTDDNEDESAKKDDEIEVDEDILNDLAKGDTSGKIPKHRFDEVNDKRKAAEAENKELRALLEQSMSANKVDFDFDSAYVKHAELIIEGDTSAAAKLMKDITEANRQQAKLDAQTEITVDTVETNTIKIVNKAMTEYPFLNPESSEFNQEAYDEVNGFQDVYFKQGIRYDKALEKALEKITPLYVKKQSAASEDEIKSNKESARVLALRRNADVANRQPPNISGVGSGDRGREGRINISNMSDAEFSSLPDAEKKRLRGD